MGADFDLVMADDFDLDLGPDLAADFDPDLVVDFDLDLEPDSLPDLDLDFVLDFDLVFDSVLSASRCCCCCLRWDITSRSELLNLFNPLLCRLLLSFKIQRFLLLPQSV